MEPTRAHAVGDNLAAARGAIALVRTPRGKREMTRVIEVVDYDPHWIAVFEQEAARLARVFGKRILEVHHIGSTAVSGLQAKPIVDILVVLDDTGDIASFTLAMEALGYRARGECLDAPIPGTPGRFYFSKNTSGVRSHQVHVCAKGHTEIADKLAFRDYLRAHECEAAAYGDLKRRLAVEHRFDTVGYTRAKDDFVKSALVNARGWYATKRSGPNCVDHLPSD